MLWKGHLFVCESIDSIGNQKRTMAANVCVCVCVCVCDHLKIDATPFKENNNKILIMEKNVFPLKLSSMFTGLVH